MIARSRIARTKNMYWKFWENLVLLIVISLICLWVIFTTS
jgi:hypothetical protein